MCDYRQKYLNEEKRAARASAALLTIREEAFDALASGESSGEVLRWVVSVVDAFRDPPICSVKLSCYTTCDHGTKGCSKVHK